MCSKTHRADDNENVTAIIYKTNQQYGMLCRFMREIFIEVEPKTYIYQFIAMTAELVHRKLANLVLSCSGWT